DDDGDHEDNSSVESDSDTGLSTRSEGQGQDAGSANMTSDYEKEEGNHSTDYEDNQENGEEGRTKHVSDKKKKPKSKKINLEALTPEELEKYRKAEKLSGVVYMSRVPPFMKPQKVHHLLEKYGEIGRIYLVPEDEKVHKRRAKYGGNRKKSYIEGWIEFKDKRVAKMVAEMLNNRQIGGKKSGFYHDDLWNLKYLPKFKWHNLTEQLNYERVAREQKLRNEMIQARKEANEYIQNVEKARMIKGIESKKSEGRVEPSKVQRRYKQRDVVIREADSDISLPKAKRAKVDSRMSSVLDQIF
ncbi:RNA-binding ATPase activator esf2, partial [Spiromyces aspiralis]